MKTREQVLAEFQRMQKQLYGKFGHGTIEVRAYDQGNGYWSVGILVSRRDDKLNAHDVWEEASWTNYGNTHSDYYETKNEKLLAEFKEKFNLK